MFYHRGAVFHRNLSPTPDIFFHLPAQILVVWANVAHVEYHEWTTRFVTVTQQPIQNPDSREKTEDTVCVVVPHIVRDRMNIWNNSGELHLLSNSTVIEIFKTCVVLPLNNIHDLLVLLVHVNPCFIR